MIRRPSSALLRELTVAFSDTLAESDQNQQAHETDRSPSVRSMWEHTHTHTRVSKRLRKWPTAPVINTFLSEHLGLSSFTISRRKMKRRGGRREMRARWEDRRPLMRAGVRPPSLRPINGTLEAKQAAIDRRTHRSPIDKRGCASGSRKGAKERGRDGNIVPVCKCK